MNAIPREMLIEVTNRCNHACVFCAHYGMQYPQGEIDPVFLKRILKEAYKMGVRRVGFYTTGEMFMCKSINEHIANAKNIISKGVGYEYIYSDTNGALAKREKLEGAIRAGLDSIKFSINAGNRESYKKIHGYDDFEKVIENLQTCYELKQSLNPALKIYVSFIATSITENEVETLRGIISPYIDEIFVHPVRAFHLQFPSDIQHLSVKDSSMPLIPCSMVFDRIHVTYDGFLSACCIDFDHDLILADLKATSLREAWNSEQAQKLRMMHTNRDLDNTLCDCCVHGEYRPHNPLKNIFPTTPSPPSAQSR